MKEQIESLETETRVLYTVSVPMETTSGTVKAVDVTKESFNVYISGLDFSGDINQNYHSDVNIIVTVNPKTHEILLTSIPRDYYINLPSKGAMDKLTHSGLYGIQETISAVEEMMGIEINYYIKVNYNTIVSLVDAMGGIDIDSPYAFTTHKMQELSGITFVEGQNHLTGSMALAYSRERASWGDGDMRRNENQQLILEAILKKATTTPTILTSYTEILDAVRGNMETSFTQDEMTSLVKMQIDKMPSWNISKTALKGKADYLPCFALGNAYASVVDQNHEMIMETADLIIKTMQE
jgi:LCP family protein required for cell wall assembly